MGQNDAELLTWGLDADGRYDMLDRVAIEDLETQEEVDEEFDSLTDLESQLDYLLNQ